MWPIRSGALLVAKEENGRWLWYFPDEDLLMSLPYTTSPKKGF